MFLPGTARPGQRPYLFRRPLLLGVLLLVSVLIVSRLKAGPPRAPAGDLSSRADGRPLAVRGRIAGPPERRGFATSFVLEVSGAREGAWGPFSSARGRVEVSAAGRPPPVDWGDEAIFWGKLKPLRGPAAPGGYDERSVLGARGIFCRLSAAPGKGQALLPLARSSPLWWVVQARRRFARSFRSLSPEGRAILAGLLLGEKPAGFPALQEDFRKSGTIHLLVASGTNVAFVLGLWWILGRWIFFLPRRAILLSSIPLAFFYAFLAGADAPVMRAAVMAAVGVAGLLLGRVDRPVHLIGFSALVLLAFDPGALFRAGFQMSYAASLGLALGMPAFDAGVQWARTLSSWPPPGGRRRGLEGALGLFAAGSLAQLALAPILIFYFRRLSWVAPLANLAAVPWGELCLSTGALLFAFDLAGLPGTGFVGAAADKAARGLWGMAGWAAKVPGAEGSLPWTGGQVAALSVAVAGTLLLLSSIKTAPPGEAPAAPLDRRRAAALAILWGVSAAAVFFFRAPRRTEVFLLWPRTGGDAAAVVGPSGATLLNAGPAADLGRVWAPFLRDRGASVQRVVLTRTGKGSEAVLAEAARLWPGAEMFCADGPAPPPPACAPLADGTAWEADGARWRAGASGSLSIEVERRRFLFLRDLKKGDSFSGSWEAVSLHPRGPVRAFRKACAGLSARRWVLGGRGGKPWEESLPAGSVRRPSRDGFLLWRPDGGGRWEE